MRHISFKSDDGTLYNFEQVTSIVSQYSKSSKFPETWTFSDEQRFYAKFILPYNMSIQKTALSNGQKFRFCKRCATMVMTNSEGRCSICRKTF